MTPENGEGTASSQQGLSVSRIDALADYWRTVVDKDKRRYADKMERIRKEEEAPSKPPLYFTPEQKAHHQLVFRYVEGLQAHEARVERSKALHDTKKLLQTVTLMER